MALCSGVTRNSGPPGDNLLSGPHPPGVQKCGINVKQAKWVHFYFNVFLIITDRLKVFDILPHVEIRSLADLEVWNGAGRSISPDGSPGVSPPGIFFEFLHCCTWVFKHSGMLRICCNWVCFMLRSQFVDLKLGFFFANGANFTSVLDLPLTDRVHIGGSGES
jgi:hypothetical protein